MKLQPAVLTLEVIACSVSDARAAAHGGADRLEVISRFEVGGLTPPLELVRAIRAAVALPLRVMVRESAGFEVTDDAEIERLCAAARAFDALGVDGLVLGFLRAGEVDLALLQRVLDCAPNLRATFHRAFEAAQDQWAAIAALKQVPQVDRILTNGGTADWPQQLERLKAYAEAAQPQLGILAGGGLEVAKIKTLRAATGIREFHLGRAVRVPQSTAGVVSARRVRAMLEAISQ